MKPAWPRSIFITGTDTGVGKTLLTAMLLHHLRQADRHALAIKPFCSGGSRDVAILDALQDRRLPRDWLNPFHFSEAVAPLVAARKHHRQIHASQALHAIRRVAKSCDYLLIEGAGGLLAPLGEGFSAAELITCLNCDVIVVASNQLGTINHTLLTARAVLMAQPHGRIPSRRPPAAPALERGTAGTSRLVVVLMGKARPDPSSSSNPRVLTELLAPVPLIPIPFLGPRADALENLKRQVRPLRRKLDRILACCAGRAL